MRRLIKIASEDKPIQNVKLSLGIHNKSIFIQYFQVFSSDMLIRVSIVCLCVCGLGWLKTVSLFPQTYLLLFLVINEYFKWYSQIARKHIMCPLYTCSLCWVVTTRPLRQVWQYVKTYVLVLSRSSFWVHSKEYHSIFALH